MGSGLVWGHPIAVMQVIMGLATASGGMHRHAGLQQHDVWT